MIKFQNLVKVYESDSQTLKAVDQVSFNINHGEIFGIVGLSGAGKSTLLRCINGIEKPTSGEVFVDGIALNKLSDKNLLNLRQNIGMIFQHFNLLSSRNVKGNIAFPLENAGWSKQEIETRVLELAKWMDLEDKLIAYPSQLSGGQKQRVAIARAIACNPKILLCDEATSALDPITTQMILKLLQKINREFGITIVLITHEIEVVKAICDRVAAMSQGKVTAIGAVSEVINHNTNNHDHLYKIS